MSTEIPVSSVGIINYGLSHIAPFGDHAAEIGLAEPEVANIAALTTTADTKKNESFAARQASKAATVAYHAAVDDLRTALVEAVAKIKARAKATDDDNIYALAEINPPLPPSPRPAPPMPTDVVANVRNDGAVEVAWKGVYDGDAFFKVERQRYNGETIVETWNQVAFINDKKFNDATLPIGTTQAMYRVRAFWGDKQSDMSEIGVVQLGVASSSQQSLQFDGGDVAQAA